MSLDQPGNLLTEDHIRTFIKCPQMAALGARYQRLDQVQVLLLEQCLSDLMFCWFQDPEEPPIQHITTIVTARVGKLVGQKKLTMEEAVTCMNRMALVLGQFLEQFKPAHYLPVSGPLRPRLTVNGFEVDTTVCGVLKIKDRNNYHWITCTPYMERQSILMDPLVALKATSFLEFTRALAGNNSLARADETTFLHMVSMGEFTSDSTLIHHWIGSQEINPANLKAAQLAVQALGIGYSQPSVPCPDTKCSVRDLCLNLHGQSKAFLNQHVLGGAKPPRPRRVHGK